MVVLETNHYKSWSGLNKQLTDNICESLQGRISYFLTRYHDVHNSYGRATIRLDGEELVHFSWVAMYQQEADINDTWKETGKWDYQNSSLKEKWDNEATFSDYDFLSAATNYLQLPIKDALESDNYLIKIFAILDRRVGKRTLEKIHKEEKYKSYPDWVQQFYRLRISE
ncbi:SF0329 family protein [Streptococcus zalophi]|uniref:Uncharacterized protein n=1 Tax=Streptococcus zalophi TaxID=640031 RepID=A0A934P8X1_9STRE|nr:hypothetical protein [Streptococcus zalophi]MBJ8349122.1 hypothetical protein [Streptococcus zalophi]